MSTISISNLTFSYFGNSEKIFENVSLQINTGWKLGLTGRNGQGKTTLLNLFLGNYEFEGKIIGQRDFKYFPQSVADKTQNTADIIETLCRDAQFWQIERELSLLGLSDEILYRPFNTLSNGEQIKVLLAALFHDDDKFLLIDEPTNHLDAEGRILVAKYLKTKKGYILVSHDRTFLDECVDHILSINRSNIEVQKGNFSSWFYNKQLQDEYELGQNEKLKKEVKRLNKSAQQAAAWADKTENSKYGNGPVDRGFIGHKAAKMMKKTKNVEHRKNELVSEKSELLQNIEEIEDLKIKPLEHHSEILVTLEDIAVLYDNKCACENVKLSIQQGQRVALKGKNGCGKTSILKLICGNDINFTGNIYRAGNLKISYIPQDTTHLSGNLREYALTKNIDETMLKTILRKLNFKREQFDNDMKDYSAGQKKKVLLAASLCESAHIYIWDEPLNYIDVFSRMQIENLLLNSNATLLFVEHDRAFENNVATHVLQID